MFKDPWVEQPLPFMGKARTGHVAHRHAVADAATVREPVAVDCTGIRMDAYGVVWASFEGRKVRPAKARPPHGVHTARHSRFNNVPKER